MKRITYIFTLLGICIFWSSSIHTLAIENDLGLWAPVYINLPINNRFTTNLEINTRIQKNITHINQLFLRPSLEYQLTKNLSVWQGYGWVTNYIPRFTREERIWQQILHEKNFSSFSLTNRLRLEERFIQDVNGTPLRARYQLRLMYPFGKTKKWSFVTFDELFVNLDSHFKGPQAGVDQNRFFVGLNRKISDNVSIEGGYQMQYINLQSPTADKLNHIVLLNTYIYLPQLFND